MASYRGDRVNPGDALDCSLYGDLRIAEEEPEEEFSSNHNLFLSPCFLLVVPLISLYLRRNPGRRIDRINSHAPMPLILIDATRNTFQMSEFETQLPVPFRRAWCCFFLVPIFLFCAGHLLAFIVDSKSFRLFLSSTLCKTCKSQSMP